MGIWMWDCALRVNLSLTIQVQPAGIVILGVGWSDGMSALQFEAGAGLLLDVTMIFGGALGIGVPMAFAIIWVCS
jgi:hypothetical protein